MTRSIFIIVTSLLYLSCPGVADVVRSRPNIILILCDDMGWGDLNCYNRLGWKDMGCKGSRRIQTPNIDGMAREGLRVTNYYANSPVGPPSRAAIMTGRFPSEIGYHGSLASEDIDEERRMPKYLDSCLPTMTGVLHSYGYTTAHFGTWHLGDIRESNGLDLQAYGIDYGKILLNNGSGCLEGDSRRSDWTAITIDHTIEFLEQNKDTPFYINCWLPDPHGVPAPSKAQMALYDNWAPMRHARDKCTSTMQTYYAVITEIDRNVGRLLEKIDALGLGENTIVILSSDNGPSPIWTMETSHSGAGSTGPFRGCKGSLYDGGVRVPFIVRWPKHTPANVVDDASILSGADLLPTLCHLAGAELADQYEGDGEDMSDVLLGKPQTRTTALLWEYRYETHGRHMQKSPMLALRRGDWKLLMNPDRSRVELYNVKINLAEVDSVADMQSAVVEGMSRELLAWHEQLPDRDKIPDNAGCFYYPWPGAEAGCPAN